MSNSLDSIKQIVAGDGFFEAILNGVSDWNNALDERDELEFDEAWVSAFEELKDLDYPVCGGEVIVSELRELVFKQVFFLRVTLRLQVVSRTILDLLQNRRLSPTTWILSVNF